jgi:hypothetical protein
MVESEVVRGDGAYHWITTHLTFSPKEMMLTRATPVKPKKLSSEVRKRNEGRERTNAGRVPQLQRKTHNNQRQTHRDEIHN